MLCIFPCACWPSECLIWRNVYKSLLPVFQLECLFLVLPICMTYLYLLEIKPFSVTSFANTFPFHRLSFLLLFFFLWCVCGFLGCAKAWVSVGSICLFLFWFPLLCQYYIRKHRYNLCQRLFCLWCYILYLSFHTQEPHRSPAHICYHYPNICIRKQKHRKVRQFE